MPSDHSPAHPRAGTLRFLPPSLELIKEARDIIAQSSHRAPVGNDLSVINMYLFAAKYGIELAIEDGILYRHYEGNARFVGYGFPCGAQDDQQRERALSRIEEDAQLRARSLEYCLLTQEESEQLDRLRPSGYELSTRRADSDYIYKREALATLPGTLYRKKRNRLSQTLRLLEQQGSQWQSERLDPERHAAGIIELSTSWQRHHGEDEANTRLELSYIQRALTDWEPLGLMGCAILVDGVLRSYAMCSYSREGELNTHFEKAHPDWRHLYPLINQETARLFPDARTINREEDLGHDGLRKAKLSYYPDYILDKYSARATAP